MQARRAALAIAVAAATAAAGPAGAAGAPATAAAGPAAAHGASADAAATSASTPPTAAPSPATLEPDRPCYADGEAMYFDGAGFRPNGRVTISAEGQQLGTISAGRYGTFRVRATLPPIWGRVRLGVVAADRWDRSISATAQIEVVSTDVAIRPAGGRPQRPRAIRARGFVGANALFAHVKRYGRPFARNIWLGNPRGPCVMLRAKRRLFPRRPPPGIYTIQFDTRPLFIPWTYPSVVYGLAIFRPLNATAASAATPIRLRVR